MNSSTNRFVLAAMAAVGCIACRTTIPQCASAPPPAPAAPEYLLVEYRLGAPAAPPAALDVHDTPKLRPLVAHLKGVAIRPPDACLDDTTTPSSAPQSSHNGDCKAWLDGATTALSNAGYRVVSWDAVLQAKSQSKTPNEIAKTLGADLVLSFTAFDIGDVRGGSGTEASTSFFASNARGENLGIQAVPEPAASDLRSFAVRAFGTPDATQVSALSLNVDATAVSPDTGESVWFYKRSQVQPLDRPRGMKILFGRQGTDAWKAVTPDAGGAPAVTGQPPPGASDTERKRLVQSGVDEFVKSFRSATQ